MGYEQSVVISFTYGKEDDEHFYNLAEKLDLIMTQNSLGVYDGHEMEINNRDGSYYLFGPSAEAIMKAIKPEIENVDFMKGAVAFLKFGNTEDAPSIEFEIE